jgi:hypothetical protein
LRGVYYDFRNNTDYHRSENGTGAVKYGNSEFDNNTDSTVILSADSIADNTYKVYYFAVDKNDENKWLTSILTATLSVAN